MCFCEVRQPALTDGADRLNRFVFFREDDRPSGRQGRGVLVHFPAVELSFSFQEHAKFFCRKTWSTVSSRHEPRIRCTCSTVNVQRLWRKVGIVLRRVETHHHLVEVTVVPCDLYVSR